MTYTGETKSFSNGLKNGAANTDMNAYTMLLIIRQAFLYKHDKAFLQKPDYLRGYWNHWKRCVRFIGNWPHEINA